MTDRRPFAALASSFFVEWLLGMVVGLVALPLVTRDGDAAAAAFGLVLYVIGALQILLRVVAVGVSVTITQELGAGRSAVAIARAGLAASAWLGLAAAVVTFALAPMILRLMHAPPDVATLALPLLRSLAVVLVLDACNATLSSGLRAHLCAAAALQAAVVMQACQLVLAIVLIRGAGPIAPLGLTGFVAAAVIGRGLGAVLQLRLWTARLRVSLRLGDVWRLDVKALAPVVRIGLPGGGEDLAHWLAFGVTVAAAGTLGTRALATHSYVVQIGAVLELYALVCGQACEIFVGHLTGARQHAAAEQLVRRCLIRGVIVSCGLAIAAAAASPVLLGAVTRDPEILALGTSVLWLGVLHEPGRNFNFVYGYALRATGDAKFPMLAGAASMIVVLAGGAWLLGEVLGLGLPGIWIAYVADEWLRGLIMCARWRSRRAREDA